MFALLAGFLARVFFAAQAFLPLRSGSRVAADSASSGTIVFVLIDFSPRVAVVTMDHSGWEKHQAQSRGD
jgi:hypothetical protein